MPVKNNKFLLTFYIIYVNLNIFNVSIDLRQTSNVRFSALSFEYLLSKRRYKWRLLFSKGQVLICLK